MLNEMLVFRFRGKYICFRCIYILIQASRTFWSLHESWHKTHGILHESIVHDELPLLVFWLLTKWFTFRKATPKPEGWPTTLGLLQKAYCPICVEKYSNFLPLLHIEFCFIEFWFTDIQRSLFLSLWSMDQSLSLFICFKRAGALPIGEQAWQQFISFVRLEKFMYHILNCLVYLMYMS